MNRGHGGHGEDGSALVLALVFLSLFGVFIAALLTYADTGLRTTVQLRDQRRTLYAVDGAVEGAITAIRDDLNAGVVGGPDCGFAASLNGVEVTVACEPQNREVTGGTFGASPLGILTLACSGVAPNCEDGLWQTSNDQLRISGGVYSNSTIRVPEGPSAQLNACPPGYPPLRSDCTAESGAQRTEVTARGACPKNPDKIVAVSVTCNSPAESRFGEDPEYAPAVVPPDEASVPKCPPASETVVHFWPGRYHSASQLTNLMTGACPGNLYWFHPGVYYFDFPKGDDLWIIEDPSVTVVGGEREGLPPLSSPPAALKIPGSCRTDRSGVQFIFAGTSRLDVRAVGTEQRVKVGKRFEDVRVGGMELCAVQPPDGQHVAIYGVKPGLGGLSPITGCLVRAPYTPARNPNPDVDPCPLIKTDGAQTTFVVQGAIYAPTAPIDIGLTNVGTTIITRGVVSRTMRIKVTPSAAFRGPIISSPAIGLLGPRAVVFTAYLSGSPNARLRARVKFHDGTESTNGSQVKVEQWSVLR